MTVEAAGPAAGTFNVTFAVEGIESQSFTVQTATDGTFSGATEETVTSGTVKNYAPPAHYEKQPYVLRMTGMSNYLKDTEEYEYKGIRIEVDGTEYQEMVPAVLENRTFTVTSELTIQLNTGLNGALMVRAATCNNFRNIVLTAVYEKKQATVAVDSVSLKNEETVKVGETVTLEATVLPENATDKTVTWESKDASIATVSDSGVVTGVKAGQVQIVATAGGKSAECTVTVEAQQGTLQPLSIVIESDSSNATAVFEYSVTAVRKSTDQSSQVIAQKKDFTEKESASISLTDYTENDKLEIIITLNDYDNVAYRFLGWTINGQKPGAFEVAKFSVEVSGDNLLINVNKIIGIENLADRKLTIVATFEAIAQPETGPFGEFVGDSLTYRTGLDYTYEGQTTGFISIPFQFVRKCSNVTLKAYFGDNISRMLKINYFN